MARDCLVDYGGYLFAYPEKPLKDNVRGWYCSTEFRNIDDNLLQFIQWDDEEPYSIAELIEEYEKDYKGSWEHAIEFSKEMRNEIEVTDVKKDLEWYRRKLERLKEAEMDMWNRSEPDSEDQAHFSGSIYALEKALEILEELDEPET